MSSLSITRIEPLHKEFVSAAKTYPHLKLVIVRPHDSIVPWPDFPMLEGGGHSMLGLSPGWWNQVLSELSRESKKRFSTVIPLWLSVDGELWNGGFYWDQNIVELKRPSDTHRAFERFQKAVEQFLNLADSVAHHFEMPADPDFWGQGITLLEARSGHRWLEKLSSMGLFESCPGCSTQLRRLKANVFLASARAIESLSDSQRSPLFAVLDEVAKAWSEGYDIVAARLNLILAEKGSQLRIPGREPQPGSTLLECRRRLAQSFRDIPNYISKLPDAHSDNWQPWPVGMINCTTNPACFIGFNYRSVTGDELEQVATLLRGRPQNWPWQANILRQIEEDRRNWELGIDQMRGRLGSGGFVAEHGSEVAPSPVLSETKRDILLILLEAEAIDSNGRLVAKEIAVKLAGRTADGGTFRARLSAMKKTGLLDSSRGSDGGYWLTEFGRKQAEKIRSLCQKQAGAGDTIL